LDKIQIILYLVVKKRKRTRKKKNSPDDTDKDEKKETQEPKEKKENWFSKILEKIKGQLNELLGFDLGKIFNSANLTLIGVIGSVGALTAQFLKLQDQVKDQAGVKGKFLFMPIRVAVIGKPHGAELKILVPLLARESLLDRVRRVLAAGVSA
jgi:glutamyl/glutaminyl-tRNA synthetase